MNLYGFVENDGVNRWDNLGLVGLPPGWHGPGSDYDPTSNPFVGPAPGTYVSIEAHFGIGIGYSYVTCCDEDGNRRGIHFLKICIGPAVGAALSVGVVTKLSGKDCRGDNYKGIFFEIGASAGPVSVGVDVGIAPDGLPSGVNDIGGGVGLGAQWKVTYCYYFLTGESITPCDCNKENSKSAAGY